MDASVTPARVETPPLLPPVLLNPFSFLWLWVLPVAVMLLLNLQGYWVIEGNMNAAEHGRALTFGLCLLGNLAAGVALFIFARRGRMSHPAWGLPAVLVQVGYLWLATAWSEHGLLPASVTAWIYPPQRFLFNQFAFAMVPLFHGILRIACARSPSSSGRAIALNLGLAIGCPVLLYGIFSFLSYARGGHESPWLFVALSVVLLGVVMFVGLVRVLMLLFRQALRWHTIAEHWAVVLIALVMPFLGLQLNRTIPFPVDFQALEVYALMTANGFILLFAVWRAQARPALSWHLLCATLPYSLYFFVVFLPYTPLSILAIIVLGAGLLVLTPTFLFILHLHLLNRAWCGARGIRSARQLVLGGVLCALLLPAFFTVRGLADKTALNAALDYVYTPAVKPGDLTYGSSLGNLRRALDSHRAYKDGLYYPLLSDYYAWLVFDSLVLPDDKLANLERIFFDSPAQDKIDPYRQRDNFWGRGRASDRRRVRRAAPPPRTVEVQDIAACFTPQDGASTVMTVSLRLKNTGHAPAEYVAQLPLSAGVSVTGFRLQVGNQLVPGKIFEKKTALWVYEMIRDTERRDPGLLYYRSPTELELRVYPLVPEAPVAVEVDFLVPAALPATAGAGKAAGWPEIFFELAEQLHPRAVADARGNLAVAGLDALRLPVAERKPYLHLIIDRSKENGFDGDLARTLATLKEKFPRADLARITLANYDVTDLLVSLTPLDRLPPCTKETMNRVMPRSGGLALDLALAHAIRLHRDQDLDHGAANDEPAPRPVFIVLSHQARVRTDELRLANAWADLVPGIDCHEIDGHGNFVTQSLGEKPVNAPLLRLGRSQRPVLPGRLVRFANTQGDAALAYWSPGPQPWSPVPGVTRQPVGTPWADAVSLQLAEQDNARSPGDAGVDLRALVQASKRSGLLLPVTSYIVVENSAQWRVLEKSEQQKLAQNQALEFTETPAPPALWVGIGFAAWWLWRRRQQRACAT